MILIRIPAKITESIYLQRECGGMLRLDGFTAASLRGMRIFMIDGEAIRQRWDAVGSKLDERGRRLFAAGEVRAAGHGGLAAVSSITGSGAQHDLARAEGSRCPCAPARPGSPRRWRAPSPCRERCDANRRSEAPCRAGDDGRSGATAAMGFEKPRQTCIRPRRDGAYDQPKQRAQASHRAWLFAAV